MNESIFNESSILEVVEKKGLYTMDIPISDDFVIDEIFLRRLSYDRVDVPFKEVPLILDKNVYFFFILRKLACSDVSSLTLDNYSPWYVKGKFATTQKYISLSECGDKKSIHRNKKNGLQTDEPFVMMVSKNHHPCNKRFIRKIYCFYDKRHFLNTKLLADVLITYSYSGGNIPVGRIHGNQRIEKISITTRMTSVQKDSARNLLQVYAPKDVARIMSNEFEGNFNREQVYNSKRGINVQSGPQGKTELDNVDAFKKAVFEHNWQLYSYSRPKEKDGHLIYDDTYLLVNPVMLSIFIKQMPTDEQCTQYDERAEAVAEILSINRYDLLSDFEDSIETKGVVVWLDFTFSLCRYQVGQICFQSINMERSSSRKPPLFAAAYIIVEKPDNESMIWASTVFSNLVQTERPVARISAIVTDKEKCLNFFKEGPLFSKCRRLLCSTHLYENLKHPDKKLGEKIAAKLFAYLFGTEKDQ